MTFQEAIQSGFSRYADFSGRSSRSAYWYWFLFALLAGIVAQVLDMAIGTYPALTAIVGLGLLIPGIAVGVRRLHDIGRSGWWYLIGIIPLIGFIVLIVFFVQESGPPNEWGAGPDDQAGAAPPPPAPPPAA